MTVYNLVDIFRKNTFSADGISNVLKKELLTYSYNNESILISYLCQAAAGMGTNLENEMEENSVLRKENKELEKRVKELELEKNKLLLDYQAEKEKTALYEKTLKEFKGDNIQQVLVKNGMKIAYKPTKGEKEVLELLKKGYTKVEIADKLGISRNTVYKRMEKIKNAGIL